MKYTAIPLVLFLFASTNVHSASFNCQKASTSIEYLICGDATLSSLDEQLASLYKGKLKGADPATKEQLVLAQRQWIEGRNYCSGIDCLKAKYEERIAEISQDSNPIEVSSPSSKANSKIQISAFKKEEPQLEERYQKALKSAYIFLTEYTLLDIYPKTPEESCRILISDMYLDQETKNRFASRCVTELTPKITVLETDLTDGKSDPKNCIQWAMADNDEWATAQHDMRYKPFLKEVYPVRFSGELIREEEDGVFLIYNNNKSTNSFIVITDETQTFDAENIKIGSFVKGFGVVYESQKVKLINGTETNVVIISATCIQ